MGNNASFQKVNFENIQEMIKTSSGYVLINTLPLHQQGCLIPTTVLASDEETIINKHLNNKNKNIKIIYLIKISIIIF